MTTAFDLGCFAANALIKESADQTHKKPYDTPQMGMQQFLPINERREFNPDEQKRIEKGKSRWIPRMFTSYGTDPAETMASPTKQGLLTALLGAGAGGLAGARLGSVGGNLESAGIGGLIGAGVGGLAGGLGGMWGREAKNESIEELMRRLPPGARMRDIMSDPVYQRDTDRFQTASQYKHL